MADVTTLGEVVRSTIDGTEAVRLATPNNNWQTSTLSFLRAGFAYPGTAGGTSAAGTLGVYRSPLTGSTTLFVSTTGSDGNTGLTSSTPMLTAQHAWDVVCQKFDMTGQAVVIQFADGTYTSGINTLASPIGGGSVTFRGNTASTGSVLFAVTADNVFSFQTNTPTSIVFDSFRIGRSASVGVNNPSDIFLNGAIAGTCHAMNFGSSSAGAIAILQSGGNLYFDAANWTISGIGYGAAGSNFLSVFWVGPVGFLYLDAATVTATATMSYGVTAGGFVYADAGGQIGSGGTVFTTSGGGSYTGRRYLADLNGAINTFGVGGPSYFPGTVAGTVATGGQYF